LANPAVTIPTEIVPLKLVFTSFGNETFDPEVANPTCSPAGTALQLTQGSPLFLAHPLYADDVQVGDGQYVNNFQRANFWSYTKPGAINSGYSINLKRTTTPDVTVPVTGGDVVAGTCGDIGLMDYATWDNYVQTQLIPFLSTYIAPTSLPVFLFSNVVLYDGS